jgi:hypothetical protein
MGSTKGQMRQSWERVLPKRESKLRDGMGTGDSHL